jgi:hypothetical protein
MAFYAFTVVCIGLAMRVLIFGMQRALSTTERDQMRLLLLGLASAGARVHHGRIAAVPGVQLPRLGTASFAVLSAILGWTFHRYTYRSSPRACSGARS